jgi:hypothetical protein
MDDEPAARAANVVGIEMDRRKPRRQRLRERRLARAGQAHD